jgi:putative hydrolase of the HAD superfamily
VSSLKDLSKDLGKDLPQDENKPHVIFLDAVGTLFGVKDSVGSIYAKVAGDFGVQASSQALDQAFYQSFKAAPALAFTGGDRLAEMEFAWWKRLAYETFERAELLAQFSDFEAFFGELYRLFATADPWVLYPDTLPALEYWQAQGIELGIISNFDSRIFSVLEALGLGDFFQSITISSLAGAAKPERKIFEAALGKHHCLPRQAWHLGDSPQEDIEGAKRAGIIPFWVDPNR